MRIKIEETPEYICAYDESDSLETFGVGFGHTPAAAMLHSMAEMGIITIGMRDGLTVDNGGSLDDMAYIDILDHDKEPALVEGNLLDFDFSKAKMRFQHALKSGSNDECIEDCPLCHEWISLMLPKKKNEYNCMTGHLFIPHEEDYGEALQDLANQFEYDPYHEISV